MNFPKLFFHFSTSLGKWWNKAGNIWLMIKRGFFAIATNFTSRKYFDTKSFITISSLFIATDVIDTDINFLKPWPFLMGVNISNEECNFFIKSETTTWQVFSGLLFLKILQLSWIHLASLVSKALSYYRTVLKWMRQGEWNICISKMQDLETTFIVSRDQLGGFLIF